MSVATVAVNKPSKRPQYKDYVSFLETYKNGRKEDQSSITTTDSGVSFSLSNSSNNSSSSVYSDLAEPSKNSFKEYLDSYNSKRYSSVPAPCHVKKQQAEAKTVKTEVFLEINSPPATVTKVVDVSEVPNVSKVSKIFENNATHTLTKGIPPSGKVNTFNFDASNNQGRKKVSVGGNHQKVQLKKSLSISEKSRVFEDSNKEEPVKVNGCLSPKPVINRRPAFIPKAKTDDSATSRTNGIISPKPFTVKPVTAPKTVVETIHLERTSPVLCTPPPPPLPPVFQQTQTYIPPPQSFQNGTCAPPPPPPPPINFSVKKIQNPPKSNVPNAQKAVVNGGPKSNDIVDGTDLPVIDKNDPRVKKMVYGALREMYGAYHDKANDYIATLPRNRVKKNNGLDSIINSIASQGGLEKLNGRVNPTVETD